MLVDNNNVIVGVYDSDKHPIHYIGASDGGGRSIYRYIDSRYVCVSPFWNLSRSGISSNGINITQGSLYVSAPVRAENLSWASLTFQHEGNNFRDYISSDDIISKIKAGKAELFSVYDSSATWMCVPYIFKLTVNSNSSTSMRRGTIHITPYDWSVPDLSATNHLFIGANGDPELYLLMGELDITFNLDVSQQGKQEPPGPTGGTENGTLRLTVNGGSGYNVITANFELRKSSAPGPQFLYNSQTMANPTTYQVAPGTYTVNLVNVSGQRGTGVAEMLLGHFDKSSITITANSTTDLRLTIQ